MKSKRQSALVIGGKRMKTRGRYGRFARTTDGRPTQLTQDTDRRVVMIMGPSGLNALRGQSDFEMIVQIGYTDDYIKRKLAEGYKFQLVTFDRPDGELRIATWKNAIAVIALAYPEVAEVITAQSRALKQTAFAEFERQAGFCFAEVDALGPGDPRFMTVARLLESDRSPAAVRRFLYHTTRLTELFTGSGLTKTSNGKPGVREYIIGNRPLSQLKRCALADLQINVPNAQ